jgi:hypothetical protein
MGTKKCGCFKVSKRPEGAVAAAAAAAAAAGEKKERKENEG